MAAYCFDYSTSYVEKESLVKRCVDNWQMTLVLRCYYSFERIVDNVRIFQSRLFVGKVVILGIKESAIVHLRFFEKVVFIY